MTNSIYASEQSINELVSAVNSLVKPLQQGKKEEYKQEKVLVLSDLHIPFHREDLIAEIVRENKDNLDLIVLSGDILDCFNVSSFPKSMHIPLYEELKIANKFLADLDKATPNVKKVIFWGNHEYRFTRFLEKEASEITPFFSTNILDILKNGFEYRDFRNRKQKVDGLSDNFVIVDNWFYQHNDTIFAHPKNFSSVNMKTAVNTYRYFVNAGYQFSAVCIGHTHKIGNIMIGRNLVTEVGCLCEDMSYANNGNINYTPQGLGYGIYYYDNGVVDIENSGGRFLRGD